MREIVGLIKQFSKWIKKLFNSSLMREKTFVSGYIDGWAIGTGDDETRIENEQTTTTKHLRVEFGSLTGVKIVPKLLIWLKRLLNEWIQAARWIWKNMEDAYVDGRGGGGGGGVEEDGVLRWREVEAVTNTRAASNRRCCTREAQRSRERFWGGVWVCRAARIPGRRPGTETLCAGYLRGRGRRAVGSCTCSWTSASRAPSRTVCSGTCLPPKRMRSGRDSIRELTSPAVAPCCWNCYWCHRRHRRPAMSDRACWILPSATGRPDHPESRPIKVNDPANWHSGRNLSVFRASAYRLSLFLYWN